MEKRFNEDNTSGYTADELEKLNEMADQMITGDMDLDEIKNIEEKILNDF